MALTGSSLMAPVFTGQSGNSGARQFSLGASVPDNIYSWPTKRIGAQMHIGIYTSCALARLFFSWADFSRALNGVNIGASSGVSH